MVMRVKQEKKKERERDIHREYTAEVGGLTGETAGGDNMHTDKRDTAERKKRRMIRRRWRARGREGLRKGGRKRRGDMIHRRMREAEGGRERERGRARGTDRETHKKTLKMYRQGEGEGKE